MPSGCNCNRDPEEKSFLQNSWRTGSLGTNVTTGMENTGLTGGVGDPSPKPAVVTEKLKPSVVCTLCKGKICHLIFLGQQMLRPRVRQPWRRYPGSSSLACAHSTFPVLESGHYNDSRV